jgi:hypothetical protein
VRWLSIPMVLFLACKQPANPPVTETTSTASTGEVTTSGAAGAEPPTIVEGTPAPSPAPKEKNIFIDGVEVANPVVVTGRARTFENNVVLRLRDARGALITETFTTATGEMGQHSPYRGTLWVTRDPGARVTVEALEYSAKDGSPQSLVSAERPYAVELVERQLYFSDDACTAVKAYVRRIPKTVSAARVVVEALIAGPTAAERAQGAFGPFPEGSRVESVNLRGDTITVDFNERLQSVGGSCRSEMIRETVTKSLQSLGIRKVVLKAGGSEELALQP